MKRGFRRNGMGASGLAVFAVVVLAVVGILLLEVGAVRGVASGMENPEIAPDDVGRIVAAQPEWQPYEEPAGPWGHYMLGLSAWKSGEVVKAVAELRTAVALDPEHVKSYVNLARALLDAGRAWEALEAIQGAVLRDAAAAGVQRVLGRCYHENDLFEEAELAYKRAIAQDPRDAWALNNLGVLYIEQQRFDEALYALASAALVSDDIAEVQNNLGVALERTGHPLAATQAYARALEIDAAYEKAQVSLARVRALAGSVADEDVNLAALAAEFHLDAAEKPVDASSLSTDVAR